MPFPWYVTTMGCCFVFGVLCTIISTLGVGDKIFVNYQQRGFQSGLYTGLLNLFIWQVIIAINIIYAIYHPAPPMSHMLPLFVPSWGSLVLILLLFTIFIGSFHVIATLFSGFLVGMLMGAINRQK